MNTLSKNITKTFYATHCEYHDVRALWKSLLADSEVELTLAHHILYAVLRGKDWRKAYTPITSTKKLDNGMYAESSLYAAKYALTRNAVYNDFESVLDIKAIEKIKSLLSFSGDAYQNVLTEVA